MRRDKVYHQPQDAAVVFDIAQTLVEVELVSRYRNGPYRGGNIYPCELPEFARRILVYPENHMAKALREDALRAARRVAEKLEELGWQPPKANPVKTGK